MPIYTASVLADGISGFVMAVGEGFARPADILRVLGHRGWRSSGPHISAAFRPPIAGHDIYMCVFNWPSQTQIVLCDEEI